mmetsp:Transcript_19275/g.44223  ORF Transcript_19275/g.44223 Transcript_19275/m.44223 type:complete len:199 (-) Transcript_19275:388-984(-)|eukprot:762522-Hanusia_phi.AAC.1
MESSTASANSDSPTLCAGGCGFFGSPQLNSYCSVCFKKTHGEEEFNRRTGKASDSTSKETISCSDGNSKGEQICARTEASSQSPEVKQDDGKDLECTPIEEELKKEDNPAVEGEQSVTATTVETADEEPKTKKMATIRCETCKKKVGLTGFHCRCGGTFCGTHRYSDKHGCTFDYKSLGREQLAKANPTICPEKLDKI